MGDKTFSFVQKALEHYNSLPDKTFFPRFRQRERAFKEGGNKRVSSLNILVFKIRVYSRPLAVQVKMAKRVANAK